MSKIKATIVYKMKESLSVGESHSTNKAIFDQTIFNDERVVDIDFEVKCSYIEIYNETIFDLLNNFAHNKL